MPVRDLNMAMIAISASLVAAGCGPRNHDVSAHTGSAIAPCGNFAVNGPLGEPVSVLDGRMTTRALVGAAVAPPARAVKGEPTPKGEETRISHDVGDDTFVIVASEVYANAKPSFDVAASHFAVGPALQRFGQVTTEPVALEAGARAIGLAPTLLEWSPGPVFVYGLLVDLGDGTVTYVAYFVKVHDEAAGCMNLARRLARTVAGGPRKLVSARGTRRLETLGAESLEITVPDDIVVVAKRREGSVMHEVHHVASLDEVFDTGILRISIGPHPRFDPRSGTPERPVTLLGTLTTWRSTPLEDIAALRLQVLVPLPSTTPATSPVADAGAAPRDQVHVFIHAGSVAEQDAFRAIAETLRVAR